MHPQMQPGTSLPHGYRLDPSDADQVLTTHPEEGRPMGSSASIVEDPVCGMRLDPDDAAATAQYEGTTYYFCSQTCHDAFVADPSTYV
jgi:YHS domain-containing protein